MKRRTPLAPLNLAHNKVRTIVATGGVAFAVTLVFMQLGFFSAVLRVAVMVYDNLDFDFVLIAPHYVSVTQPGSLPQERLYQAMGVDGVRSAAPLYVDRIMWMNPDTRRQRSVILLGADPADRVFKHPEIDRQSRALLEPDTVLVDRLSRPDVGPLAVGTVTELGGRETEVVGQFTLGPGFEAGLAVTGSRTFSQLYHGRPLQQVSVGLIRLDDGADPAAVADELRHWLPPDVEVLTRPQIEAREQWYWVVSTSTGIIFGSGVVVAYAFGIVIIYQVLSTEISTRIGEYATLKAMGYSERYISGVVLQQAAILSVMGYVPALLMAFVIYALTETMTKLPVSMTAPRAVAVFLLTLVMCALAGFLSARIVRTADPAELF
jgi:putative ABC transport system permease protein